MNTTFYTPLVDTQCPKDKNVEKCPLRNYLKKQDLFTLNDNILQPTAELYRLARAEYVNAINKINLICRNCKETSI